MGSPISKKTRRGRGLEPAAVRKAVQNLIEETRQRIVRADDDKTALRYIEAVQGIGEDIRDFLNISNINQSVAERQARGATDEAVPPS